MTILILRTGAGAKSLVKCDTCGEEEERLTCTCKKSKLHFCDLECKAEYGHIPGDGHVYSQYHKDMCLERRDAKLLKQDEVKKRCMTCGRIYYGPPGDFPKGRDPNEPEPGLCGCKQRIPYDAGETAGMVRV